jgi:hypothetical protein
MKFDLVITNPPFQDSERRGKTPHKLWIDFTIRCFDKWLKPGGYLAQVSPSSFRSPNSRVLDLMKRLQTTFISFDSGAHFPDVGSSFAHYVMRNSPREIGETTEVISQGRHFRFAFKEDLAYLPNQLMIEDLQIHSKVMFQSRTCLKVEWDYVTCHNIRIHNSDSLSRERTRKHKYPVLHTNRQIWWSSIQQPFATKKKVMWSRSGYTLPFFDKGELGGTDMAYFIVVRTVSQGRRLEKILNSALYKYIFNTAKWSGFGNERVFSMLPELPESVEVTDEGIFDHFSLNDEERNRVRSIVG